MMNDVFIADEFRIWDRVRLGEFGLDCPDYVLLEKPWHATDTAVLLCVKKAITKTAST